MAFRWLTRSNVPVVPSDHPRFIDQLLDLARTDPAFDAISRKFDQAGVLNWLEDDEKRLHFGVAAFAQGNGVLVEIGSFEGGSAIFSGAGLQRRGKGMLTSIDPHLGGPPWLGMAPYQRTLEKFRKHTRFCGVADWITTTVADSVAAAAVWPAEPIDSVFIDGDHSFMGALKDFECWAPKVRPGGLVLLDDVDDPYLPEVIELGEYLKTLGGVDFLGVVRGIAVYRRTEMPAANLLAELSSANASRGILRPWDMTQTHSYQLPASFKASLTGDEKGMFEAYHLCYLAKCSPGAYGFSPTMPATDKALMSALSRDCGDGPCIDLTHDTTSPCRALVCWPEEAETHVNRLLPGGVLISRNRGPLDLETESAIRKRLLAAGLEGCGAVAAMHWGAWQPFHLSAEALLAHTRRAYGVTAVTRP
jgi:predicted O-methyltransferase YrrM